MEQDPTEFVNHLVFTILPFLPVLFGAVEYIKSKSEKLSGGVVEGLAILLFVLYGALALMAFFFPAWGFYLIGGFVFLLMCALAPSGYYKFISARTSEK